MNVISTIVAGIGGAAAMSLLMMVIHRSRWANADMIRALGGFVTRGHERAVPWGVAIHLASGVIFAFVYAAAMSLLEISSVAGCAGIGSLMGLFHGFAMSFILIAVVSEKHPLPEFREAGFDVGIAHIAGHIAYGAVVGLLVGIFGIHYALGA